MRDGSGRAALKLAAVLALALCAAPAGPAVRGDAGSASDDVPATVDAAPAVPLYGVFERTFASSGDEPNPYVAVTASATLTAPDGRTLTLPLFWDGGRDWTLRFSPDATGTWSLTTSSSDPGLDGHAASIEVGAPVGGGGIRRRAAFPYHFERQDGTPFWWMGDTQWWAFGADAAEGLDRASLFHYADVRSTQGFNYVHAQLTNPGVNEGGAIFESVAEETLNAAYFREVDARIRYMNLRGITVGIVLAWGSEERSWDSFPSDEARLRYARYVASRYGAYDVVFVVSGEWDEAAIPRESFLAIGHEIESADPHGRPVAIHGTGAVEEFADESWMSLGDYQQLYTALHQHILAARDHAKPVVNAEYAYYLLDADGDGDVDKPNSATLAQTRHATWDVVMAGGYFVTGWGTTYLGGGYDAGPFNPDDPRNDAWEDDVRHVRSLFTGLEWWRLEPADALLSGPGTRYALAWPGQQYVAYTRGASGPVSLSLGAGAAGSYALRRFNPRTGASVALAAYSGAGPVSLAPPDRQDWVFVLTRSGPALNQPPSVGAGPDRAVVQPAAASLEGGASDDGLPSPPGALATAWSQVSGPATASFADPSAPSTTARFSAPGVYVLRLTASDGALTTSDDVRVTVSASAPVTVSLAPEADTYVDSVNPDTSFGAAPGVVVGGPPYQREIYIRFDLAGLPAGAVVTDARLLVLAWNGSTAAGGGGTIRRFAPAMEQWDEARPTWTAPLAGTDASPDLATVGPVSIGGSYTFSGLEGALAGNGRVTFVIRSGHEDGAGYYSREHDVAPERPVLRVTYVVN